MQIYKSFTLPRVHEHVYEEIDKQTKAVLIIMDKNTKQQNTVKQEGFLAQLPCCPVGWLDS